MFLIHFKQSNHPKVNSASSIGLVHKGSNVSKEMLFIFNYYSLLNLHWTATLALGCLIRYQTSLKREKSCLAILTCHLMSLEHFLNSLVVVWGSCRLPCGSLVSKHVPWLQVLSSQPSLGICHGAWPSSGAWQTSALVLLPGETQALSLHVFSLTLQTICLTSVADETGARLGCEGVSKTRYLSWSSAAPGSTDRPSAWPDKKPLLQLAFLYLTGVLSAVVAQETPKCGNLAHARHLTLEGWSRRTTKMRVQKTTSGSALAWTALSYYGQLRSNFGNARPDHCSSGNWFPFA